MTCFFFSQFKHMEDLKSKSGHLKEHVNDYVQSTIQLAKAKATKGASSAAAGTVIGVSAFLLGLFFLIFLFVAIGFWLGDLLDSRAAGFFCVAGFFLLLLILIFALRNKVIVPAIRNAIISKVYEQQSH
jgi:protein-S-isoprenylcysteine O-methyltransferase Ste14